MGLFDKKMGFLVAFGTNDKALNVVKVMSSNPFWP
jgi:hypothetical protein